VKPASKPSVSHNSRPSLQIKTGASGSRGIPDSSVSKRLKSLQKKVKDKIVILGLTIEGVGGIISTPTGEKWAHEVTG